MSSLLQRALERLHWWRHAWIFEWAHKPLCDAYGEDVLRIGKLHLCRGCSALGLGLLFLGPLLLAGIGADARPLAFAASFLPAAILSHPRLHSRWPRVVRDLLRASAGCAVASGIAMAFAGPTGPGLVALALLALTRLVYARQRAPRRLERCTSCPENGAGVCSGYALQAESIRSWEESAWRREARRRGLS